MPYFFIFPIYVLVFAGLCVLALGLSFIPHRRYLGVYAFAGTIGTLPGVIVGNVMFWIASLVGLGISRPLLETSPLNETPIGQTILVLVGIVILITGVVGLIIANIVGGMVGFGAGVYLAYIIHSQLRLRKSTPPLPPAPAPN